MKEELQIFLEFLLNHVMYEKQSTFSKAIIRVYNKQ